MEPVPLPWTQCHPIFKKNTEHCIPLRSFAFSRVLYVQQSYCWYQDTDTNTPILTEATFVLSVSCALSDSPEKRAFVLFHRGGNCSSATEPSELHGPLTNCSARQQLRPLRRGERLQSGDHGHCPHLPSLTHSLINHLPRIPRRRLPSRGTP